MKLQRAFMKYYKTASENSLKIHTDNSYISVSLCIVGDCEGCDVQFKNNATKLDGVEAKSDITEEFYTLKSRPGMVYIFFGRHPHQATPLISGERANLILWYT